MGNLSDKYSEQDGVTSYHHTFFPAFEKKSLMERLFLKEEIHLGYDYKVIYLTSNFLETPPIRVALFYNRGNCGKISFKNPFEADSRIYNMHRKDN